MSQYYEKYLKYKTKYLQLKNMMGGHRCPISDTGFHQFVGECGNNSMLMILLFSDFGYTSASAEEKHYVSNIFQDNLMKHIESKKQFLLENKDPDGLYRFTPLNGNNQFIPLNFELTPEDIDMFDKISQQLLNDVFDRLMSKLDIELETPELSETKISKRIEKYQPDTQDVISLRSFGNLKRKLSICKNIDSIKELSEILNYNEITGKYIYTDKDHGQNSVHNNILINIFNYYLLDNSNYIVNLIRLAGNEIIEYQLSNPDKILGLYLSIDDSSIPNSGHAIAFFKCNSKQYYYDTNHKQAENGYNQTLIEYNWLDDLLKKFKMDKPKDLYQDDKMIAYYFNDMFSDAKKHMSIFFSNYTIKNVYFVSYDNNFNNFTNNKEYIRPGFIWKNERYIQYLKSLLPNDDYKYEVHNKIIPIYLFKYGTDIEIFKEKLLQFFEKREADKFFADRIDIIFNSLVSYSNILSDDVVNTMIEHFKTIKKTLSRYNISLVTEPIISLCISKYGSPNSEFDFKSKLNEILEDDPKDEDLVIVKYINIILNLLINNEKLDIEIFKNIIQIIKSVENNDGVEIIVDIEKVRKTPPDRYGHFLSIEKIYEIYFANKIIKEYEEIKKDSEKDSEEAKQKIFEIMNSENPLSTNILKIILNKIDIYKNILKNFYDDNGDSLFHVMYKNNKMNSNGNLLLILEYVDFSNIKNKNNRNILHELFDNNFFDKDDRLVVFNRILETTLSKNVNLLDMVDSENNIPFYYLCIKNIYALEKIINEIYKNKMLDFLLLTRDFYMKSYLASLRLPLQNDLSNVPYVNSDKKIIHAYIKKYVDNYITDLFIKYNVHTKIADKFKDNIDPLTLEALKILNLLDEFLSQNNNYCSNDDNLIYYYIFKNSTRENVLSSITSGFYPYSLKCESGKIMHVILRNDINMDDYNKLAFFLSQKKGETLNIRNGELEINTLLNTLDKKTDKRVVLLTIILLLSNSDYSGHETNLRDAYEKFNNYLGEFSIYVNEIAIVTDLFARYIKYS